MNRVLVVAASVFCCASAPASAAGVFEVLEFYEKALSKLGTSIDKTVEAEQQRFATTVNTEIEILYPRLPSLSEDNQSIKEMAVEIVENRNSTSYLNASGAITSSIDQFSSAVSAISIVRNTGKIFSNSAKLDKLANRVSELVKSGDFDTVELITASINSGRIATGLYGGTSKLNSEISEIIVELVEVGDPNLAGLVMLEAANISTEEYQSFLRTNSDDVRIFVAQQGLIESYLSAGNGDKLEGQQLYGLEKVSGWLSDSVRMDDGDTYTFSNFNGSVDFERSADLPAAPRRIALTEDVEQLQRLLVKYQNDGGDAYATSGPFGIKDQIADLVILLSPELENLGQDELVRRAFVNLRDYEDRFPVVPVELPGVNSNPGQLVDLREPVGRTTFQVAEWFDENDPTTWSGPKTDQSLPEESDAVEFVGRSVSASDNVRDIELVTRETTAGKRQLGNNAGTSIPLPSQPVITPVTPVVTPPVATPPDVPTGPTPEELAALRLQEIADLEAARDRLSLTQQDAQARLQERSNRLTVLQFNELEKVTEASGLVSGRIQELRTERSATGLSASDQQLLLDLVAYEDRLQTEQERIAQDITSAQNAISQYEATLAQLETQLETNAASLEGPDYSVASDYTVPNFTPEGLTDWTNYEYELPAFDPTELLTSDLSNVVGHAVSVPVVGGNNRVDIDLVAEDNTILDLGIPGAITEIEDENSELLDGFTHLYFGSGVDEYGDDSQWIYGEASTPEQFALRTGTATFNGGLLGYYAHGTATNHILYQESVFGELALNIDFGTNRLTGEGRIEIDNDARSEVLGFTLNESTISETDSGLTRSLGFSANAILENESGVGGNLSGTFYGEDASEAAGSFGFNLGTGFSAGLWAAGENYEPTQDGDYPVIVSYSDLNGGITDRGDQGIGKIPELGDNLTLTIDGTATTVTSVSNVQAGDYDYTSMGQWTGRAPSSPINTGYWVAGEATPTSGLDVRTGSAIFAGNIIGDYVPPNFGRGDVVREDASGTIRLTADFSQDQIEGEMQFVSAFNASEIISLESSISNTGYFFQKSDGNENDLGFGYGFSGTFFGPDATELGGSVWAATNEGSYNGVFRAGEDLTFGGFVTPTTTDPSDPTDYSNYRGLAAYAAFDADDASFPVSTDFVALDTINSTPTAFFENTSVNVPVEASTDSLGQSYTYTNWGAWDNDGGALVDGVAGRDVAANWIVYDPTTDLRTTGQATYSGDAVGLTSDLQDVSGNIQLTADFANDTVTGNMSLNTSNGQSWADTSFDTTIRRDTDSSGFQGALTGSDVNSGNIFGGFAGPNAEEVGGGWQIDNANGTDGVGIFRAQN